MGYTRYWSVNKDADTLDDTTLDTIRAIVDIAGEDGISIKNWDGTGKPTITDTCINLNGDSDLWEDHENFKVSFPYSPQDWRFCKTARKPYDVVVYACLRLLKEEGYVTSISADGDYNTDAAKKLVERAKRRVEG